ncbi:CPBP family intramembrane glutamic endopeptidase [Dethiobacter alkaliphilus]|uniref:CPBP family intramembrane glutamic endopeptidase n=1 Tax=Dethiobacter alkaliphilus TaxID=427926 RepID=UPI0022271570|nr:CPBP family intramembrane glutamic endopeptidase [Dethiobacter alkaliphilus]MCW3490592.1 CPBP family intramembrane metalloprotease [Dethiobacter alkaliphilus]
MKSLVIAGKIVLTVVVVFVLTFVAVLVLGLLGSVLSGQMDPAQFVQLPLVNRLLLIISTAVNIGAVLIMYYLFERNRGWPLGWRQENRWRLGKEGAIWGIGIMTAAFLIIWALGGIQVTGFTLEAGVIDALLFSVVLFTIVAAGEELLCRGYWYGLIKNDFGPQAAIVGTSVVFAALHLMNSNVLQSPVPIINLLLAGVLLGVAREVTGGLWVPMGIHFSWNLFQGNIFGFAVSGLQIEHSVMQIETAGSQLLSGGGFGAEGSLVTTAILVAFTLVIARKYQNEVIYKSL